MKTRSPTLTEAKRVSSMSGTIATKTTLVDVPFAGLKKSSGHTPKIQCNVHLQMKFLLRYGQIKICQCKKVFYKNVLSFPMTPSREHNICFPKGSCYVRVVTMIQDCHCDHCRPLAVTK